MRKLGLIVSGVALAVALSAATSVVRAEDHDHGNLEEMVKNAKTPADHQALAKHYDELAAEATKNAAMHRSMASSYKASPGFKGANPASMVQHCENLAKSFDAQATELKAMAAAHRQMAAK